MSNQNQPKEIKRKKHRNYNPNFSKTEMAKRFKAARKQSGFDDLSEAGNASGVPVSTIWKLEAISDNTNVGYRNIADLANAYNVNVAWLLGQSDSPSLDEDQQNASRVTGLTDKAICILQSMKQSGLIDSLNSLLESDEFMKMMKSFDSARIVNAQSTESEEKANLIDGLTQWGTDNGMNPRNNRVSDRQLIDIYIWKASQEIVNAFRRIMKGDKDNGKR